MTYLYDLLYLLAVSLLWPLLLWRRFKRGPGSVALRERFGDVPSRRVSAHCVWIHAVSLGEINATRTLVARLKHRCPEAVPVISATTQTGLARAKQLYPNHVVFRFPLDFSFVLRRALRRIRPSVIVLMELEVWPNLLEVAAQHGIPVVIANGRVTANKSVRRFNWPIIRWVARRMFRQLAWVGAQDQTYADRFKLLGVPADRVTVSGSLKYDAADTTDQIDGQHELATAMRINTAAPLLVCGSTGPGEEEVLLTAYQQLRAEHPTLQLALIPRKPERFDDVARLISERGFTCLRRSNHPDDAPTRAPDEPPPVFLGDTMGELRKFYALATVVFVGRSLVPMGGSDVMEAAGLARPLLFGPHMENFAEAAGALLECRAAQTVTDAASLSAATTQLLNDEHARSTAAAAARDAIIARRGATDRIIDQLIRLGEMA